MANIEWSYGVGNAANRTEREFPIYLAPAGATVPTTGQIWPRGK